MQPTSVPHVPRKKSGKDGTPSYSGETEEPTSERGTGSTKDAAKKESDSAAGQGPQARRTSLKQNYLTNYYQEKASADAGLADTPFAPPTTQVLAYEPLQLSQSYSHVQTSQPQKSKKKGASKAGQPGGYSAHAMTGKYGRADGPAQPAMTEAEQRAATKKEIIEAFEIQNTQQNQHSNS